MKSLVVSIIVIVGIVGGSFWLWQNKKDKNPRVLLQSKIVTVDDGAVVLGVRTEAKTVGEFLEQQKVKLKEGDKIYPQKEIKIDGGMSIKIERAISIVVKVDGQDIKKNVLAQDVQEVLEKCQVKLNPLDRVEPSLDSLLFSGMEIVVTRINHKEITKTEGIDFKTIERNDKNLKWRTEKVKQKGEKGKKEVKYLVTYKNGKEIKRKKLSTEIIKKPVDEVIVAGTKIKVGKKQRGRASWYAYTGKMAAASITFPKGTWLRVTAVNSGKQIFVMINDYGPSPETGKILDLDKVAFQKLAPIGAGVIEVKIEEIL